MTIEERLRFNKFVQICGFSLELEKTLANVLDDLGKAGWEMISTGYTDESQHIVYFKREIEG